MYSVEVVFPVTLLSPVGKKNFISSTPCGVWMYLLDVALLTVDSCRSTFSATTLKLSGLKYLMPWSKKSLCNSTRHFATLYNVSRRCSILRSNQAAAFNLLSTKRRVFKSQYLSLASADR
ncbi:MAG: hypothetical protein BWY65_02396 [Firmicutes bacterium ADurb.Bin373]|nr:MAG: hypothetical protein BWY65_02396 [Firmicutes bacterium ADurb.Bin373]